MARKLLFVLLLAGALVTVTRAQFTIQATNLAQFQRSGTFGNLTKWQTRTITFEASDTNFRDTSLVVETPTETYYYDMELSPPKYLFEVTNRMFVPKARRQITTEVCLVNTGSAVSNQDSNLNNGGVMGRRRRLLSSEGRPEDAVRGFSRSTVSHIDAYGQVTEETIIRKGHERKPLFWGVVAGLVVGAVVNKYKCDIPVVNNLFDCNNNDNNPDPGLLEAERKVTQLRLEFDRNMTKWAQTSLQLEQEQQSINRNISVITEQLNRQAEKTLNITNTLELSIRELTNNTDARFAETTTKIVDIYDNLEAGFAVVDADVNELRNLTTRNFQKVANLTRDMLEQINENERRNVQKHQDSFRFSRKQIGTLDRRLRRQQAARVLATQHHVLREQFESTGLWTAFLHPSYRGFAPTVLTDADKKVLVDEFIVNFVNTTEGGHPFYSAGVDVAHHYSFAVYCNFDSVLDEAVRYVLYSDFLELIGPVGCTNSSAEPVTNCRCWIETKHAECQLNPSHTWEELSSDTRDDYRLVVGGSSPTISLMCATGSRPPTAGFSGVAAAWHNRRISTIAEFHHMLGTLCSVTPSLSTPLGPYVRHQQHMISVRRGRIVMDIRASSMPGKDFICRPDLDYIYFTNAQRINLPYFVYDGMVIGYTALIGELTNYERNRYGLLPAFQEYEMKPFQYLSDNRTYECVRGSFMVVSKDTRPVYTIRSLGVEPLFTASAYLEPPVCGVFGCTFGTPVSVEQTASLQVTANFENLLPDSSKTIFGDWWTSTTPAMTSIFDIPEGAAPASTAVFDRENKITYINQPVGNYSLANNTDFNVDTPASLGGPYPDTELLDSWQDHNAGDFRVMHARYTPDIHQRSISSGRCINEADIPVQWVCEMLEHWRIHPTTDMRNGLLVLEPRSFTAEVTVRIVDGEVSQRVADGCPEFAFYSYDDGSQKLELRNTLTSPVRAVVRVVAADPSLCPIQGDRTYAMQPRQVSERWVLPCGLQTITVFTISVGEELIQCEQPINTTYVPNAAANIRRSVVEQTNRSWVSDEALAQYANLEITLGIQLFRQLSEYSRLDLNTDFTTAQRSAAIEQALALYEARLNASRAAAAISNIPTAGEVLQPIFNQLDQQQAELAASIAQTDASIANLNAAIDAKELTLSRFANETRDLVNTLEALIIAEEELLAAQDKELARVKNASGAVKCSWCYNVFDGLLSILGKIICPIPCALAAALETMLYIGLIICALLLCGKPCLRILIKTFSAVGKKAAEGAEGAIAGTPQQQQPQQQQQQQAPMGSRYTLTAEEARARPVATLPRAQQREGLDEASGLQFSSDDTIELEIEEGDEQPLLSSD